MYTRWWTENLSMNKNTILRSLLLLTVCFALILSAGCSLLPEEDTEEQLPEINPPKLSKKPEYSVTTATLETTVNAVGSLMSTQEETLFFTLDKRLKDLNVKPGDKVQQGQLIAALDVEEMERDLRTKKLQFKKTELQMIETLRKADEMEPEELEQAKIDFEMQRTQLTDAEQQIAKAKLTAPFSGTIVSVNVQKGANIKAYDPVVVIADLSKLTVAADVNQEDLKKVAIGMETVVTINGSGQFKGKVKQLPSPSTNSNQDPNQGYDPFNPGVPQQQQKSIENYLLVELSPFPKNMNRGTPLNITIVINRKENAVVIPPSALRTFGGRNYVQVVESDGTKREVDVEIGQQTSTQVEIVKGLTPGQKVVGK